MVWVVLLWGSGGAGGGCALGERLAFVGFGVVLLLVAIASWLESFKEFEQAQCTNVINMCPLFELELRILRVVNLVTPIHGCP